MTIESGTQTCLNGFHDKNGTDFASLTFRDVIDKTELVQAMKGAGEN